MMKKRVNKASVFKKRWILYVYSFSALAASESLIDISSYCKKFNPIYLSSVEPSLALSHSTFIVRLQENLVVSVDKKRKEDLHTLLSELASAHLNISLLCESEPSYAKQNLPSLICFCDPIAVVTSLTTDLDLNYHWPKILEDFNITQAKVSVCGHYDIPYRLGRKQFYKLPNQSISKLENKIKERKELILCIPTQDFSNPIVSEEILVKNKNEVFLDYPFKILQTFDTFEETSPFNESSYFLTQNFSLGFVFPAQKERGYTGSTPIYLTPSPNQPLFLFHLDPFYASNTFFPSKEQTTFISPLSIKFLEISKDLIEYPTWVISSDTRLAAFKSSPIHFDEKFPLSHLINKPAKNDLFANSASKTAAIIMTTDENKVIDIKPKKDRETTYVASLINSPFVVKTLIQNSEESSQALCCLSNLAYVYNTGSFVSHDKLFFAMKFGEFAEENLLQSSLKFNLQNLQKEPSFQRRDLSYEKTTDIFLVLSTSPLFCSSVITPKASDIYFENFNSILDPTLSKAIALSEKIYFDENMMSSLHPTDLEKSVRDYSFNRCLENNFLSSIPYLFEETNIDSDLALVNEKVTINNLKEVEPADSIFAKINSYHHAISMIHDIFKSNQTTHIEERFSYLEIHPQEINKLTATITNFNDSKFFDQAGPSCLLQQSSFSKEQRSVKPNLLAHYIKTQPPFNSSNDGTLCDDWNHQEIALVNPFNENMKETTQSMSLNRGQRKKGSSFDEIKENLSMTNYVASDDFIIDLQITPNPKEGGYIFSATLNPEQKKLETHCPQNYIFLVDRSGSIEKNKFQSFKQGVSKALNYLNDYDCFNIITFDTEISKMSHQSVFATSSAKHGAKRYLENQKRGYQYGVPNISALLLSLQPLIKASELPTTIVLLTSGKTLDNYDKEVDEPLLKKQLKSNKTAFTLFTAGCSDVTSSSMIEMLSHLNRGEFVISQTNAAFPRKLAALVKHATYLAASNVYISTASKNSDVKIQLYPSFPIAPNLYGDKAYTIIGKINKLSDFDLIVQGKFCENTIFIKKRVSFANARHAGHSIMKDLKTFTAYNHFYDFYEDGNVANLEKATDLLKQFKKSF